VVFAGDDTWMGLFPDRFSRSYPYPSFDVWDLVSQPNSIIPTEFSPDIFSVEFGEIEIYRGFCVFL
jgi:hypothetical protein